MKNEIDIPGFSHLLLEKELKNSERGFVYRVRDKDTRQLYICRSFIGDGEVYRRLRGVYCPHLPRIYGVQEKDGRVYVLEEYIRGDTLAFLMAGEPFDEKTAKKIAEQVCRALTVLHDLGAVHRDIKPENVILRGSDAVLIDFDASRICKPDTETDTRVMGTTGYAAPEQYGFSQTDARTDVYAVGILLNEMLTKEHPSRKLAGGKYRTIIERCTQINASRRYETALQLIRALNKAKYRVGRRIGTILAAAALSTLAVALVVSGVSGIGNGSTEPEYNIQVFERKQCPPPEEPWPGVVEGNATSFTADMDGDGKSENYVFGVAFDKWFNTDRINDDINSTFHGCEHLRYVFPCVWRIEKDGTQTVMEEFATLLRDAKITVWRVDDFDSKADVWTQAHTWPGCVQARFYPEQDSTWVYEATAYLDESRLTATAWTIFYYDWAYVTKDKEY